MEGIFETPGGGTSQIGGSAASGHQHEAVSSLPLPAGASHFHCLHCQLSPHSQPLHLSHSHPLHLHLCPHSRTGTTTFFKVTQAPLAGILLSSSCNEWWTVPCSVWGCLAYHPPPTCSVSRPRELVPTGHRHPLCWEGRSRSVGSSMCSRARWRGEEAASPSHPLPASTCVQRPWLPAKLPAKSRGLTLTGWWRPFAGPSAWDE